jgi:hypothetical protein
METERFWVLGGRYTSTRFHTVRDGELQAIGPFDTRDDARAEWRRLNQEHSPRGDMRFSILSETLRLPA